MKSILSDVVYLINESFLDPFLQLNGVTMFLENRASRLDLHAASVELQVYAFEVDLLFGIRVVDGERHAELLDGSLNCEIFGTVL